VTTLANEREQLVEATAIEALRLGEANAEELLALGTELLSAREELSAQDDELLRAVVSRWVLDSLGDNSVFMLDSMMEQAGVVRDQAAQDAVDSGYVRTVDWFEDAENTLPNLRFTAKTQLEWQPWPYMPGFHEWNRAPFEVIINGVPMPSGVGFSSPDAWRKSRGWAAREIAEQAWRDWIGRQVQAVAENVTMLHGFDFWTDHYVSVEWAEDDPNGAHLHWTINKWDAGPAVSLSLSEDELDEALAELAYA
jgi:hypothetical protein